MNDQTIIDLIRSGRQDISLNKLYKLYPVVRKMINSKGGSRDDAEDIFQEALIIFVRKISNPEFKLTAQLSTYLYSICRFLWNDERKRRSHMEFVSFEMDMMAAETPEIFEMIENESRAKLAEQVINDLKERCRELLLLFYHSRVKLKEIAEKMGYSSEHTAKNQKYKCLENAKNRLKELQTI